MWRRLHPHSLTARVWLALCLLAVALAGCNLSRVTETPPPAPTGAHTPFDLPPLSTEAAPTLAPAPPGAPERMLFLGDSIMQGWNIDTVYPGAVNAGRRGDTSAQVLARYQAEYAGQPFDAALLLVGINDITGGVTDPVLRDNVEALVALLQARGGRVLVGSVLPVGGGLFSASVSQRIQDTNLWLRELARGRNLEYVDYYSLLADPGGRAVDAYFQDGLHPSRLGYAVMSDALAFALRQAN